MILLFPVMIAAIGLSFWAFFRFSPAGMANFNRTAVLICAGMAVYQFWSIRRELAGTPDAGWWPVAASLRAAFFAVVFLGVLTSARFLWLRLLRRQ